MKRTLVMVSTLTALTICLTANASELPEHRGWVNDYAGVMSMTERADLTTLITQFEQETSTEIAVVTIRTTSGVNPKTYAGRLFNAWGVGKAEKDNGLVVLLAMEERRLEVEVGIGLEAALPDATVTRLLERHAVPHLKRGAHGAALRVVVEQSIRLIREDIAAPALRPESDPVPAGKAATGTLPASGTNQTGSVETDSGPRQRRIPQDSARPRHGSKPSSSPSRWFQWLYWNAQFLMFAFEFVVFAFLVSYFFREKFPDLTFFIVAAVGLAAPLALVLLRLPLGDSTLLAAGGSGLSSLVTALKLRSHRCPRCTKWMEVHSRTLQSATYTSTGRGEKTESCRHCSYHNVSIYTIAREDQEQEFIELVELLQLLVVPLLGVELWRRQQPRGGGGVSW